MASTSWRPDVVVAIDFGMTFTGVAYSRAPEWSRPITIQQWPGRLGIEFANKVKTAVAFSVHDGTPTAWGFLCEDPDNPGAPRPDFRVEDLFKLHIDPDFRDSHDAAPTSHHAQTWFWKYMDCLHEFLQNYFTDRIPRWTTRKVEFIFSVPTTWKNPAMIAQIKRILGDAGFGQIENHRLIISLTEAEAAAVYAANEQYRQDDVILVCDAGGGTTDVNILKIASVEPCTKLTQLSCVEGRIIGSALIDRQLSAMIEQRLELVKNRIHGRPQELADHMLCGRFESIKCHFGTEASNMDVPLPVPGLEPGLDFPGSRIENSKMIIKKEELQQLFDEQVNKIIQLVDSQLRKLRDTHVEEVVSYIVVSGGLGSSPYLRQRLRDHYQTGAGHVHSNIYNLEILLAEEPQLAVCHGLVMNRVQEIACDSIVYTSRCCRASYGIVCRERYDKHRHVDEDIKVDPHDKKKWVDGQIHWVIRKGEPIDVAHGISYKYRLKRALGTERQPWRTQIVMSPLPPDRLPRSLKHDGGVVRVCKIESTLDHADMVRRNAKWYHLAREYWLAEFDMRILIGPADLRFQLVGQSGPKAEKGVEVEWDVPDRSGAGGGRGRDGRGEEEWAGMYRA